MDLTAIPFIASPNKSARGGIKPQYIVIHCQEGSQDGSIAWFKNPKSQVSAHYLISKKGDIVCMVKTEDKAWHAMNFNPMSIGLELEGKDCTKAAWTTEIQLEKVAELTAALMKKYVIPLNHIVGHNDPLLKKYGNNHFDPGIFPWDHFKELIKKYL